MTVTTLPFDDISALPQVGSAARGPSRAFLAPIAAFVLLLIVGGTAIPWLSPTIDEWGYVQDGVRFWFTGDAKWLIDAGTLPCVFWVQGIPGAIWLGLTHGNIYGAHSDHWDLANRLSMDGQLKLLYMARATNLLLAGGGTIFAVWILCKRWFGNRAAACAVIICALEPNLLAGYLLATADAMVVPLMLLSVAMFQSFLERSSRRLPVGSAVLFAVATAMKVTAIPQELLLIGTVFLTDVVRKFQTGQPGSVVKSLKQCWIFWVVYVPAFLLVALTVSWTLNAFKFGSLLGASGSNHLAYGILSAAGISGASATQWVKRLTELPVPAPITVLRSQIAHTIGGHPVVRMSAWGQYPLVFILKMNLCIGILFIVGVSSREVWRTPIPWGALLLVLLSSRTSIQGGPRYFLVLLAIICTLAGVGWARMMTIPVRPLRWSILLLLAVAGMLLTLRSWPEFLTHTNVLFGGDAQGYRYADAGYDWGQGLYRAFAAADRMGLKSVAFIHSGNPDFGVSPERRVIHQGPTDQMVSEMDGQIVAVSVHLLWHTPKEFQSNSELYRALTDFGSSGRLTDTFFLYDLRTPSRVLELKRLIEMEAERSRS